MFGHLLAQLLRWQKRKRVQKKKKKKKKKKKMKKKYKVIERNDSICSFRGKMRRPKRAAAAAAAVVKEREREIMSPDRGGHESSASIKLNGQQIYTLDGMATAPLRMNHG